MQNKSSGKHSWADFYTQNTNTDVRRFYPENFVTRIFLSKSPVQFINEPLEGKSILDLGCGHGRHLPFLLTCGLQVTGLEVSDDVVNGLADNFKQVSFVTGSASNIPLSTSSLDFVLAANSVYYLDSDESDIKSHFLECNRVLKGGGLFIFSLLGEKHSLLNNADKVNNHGVYRVANDFLGFRDGVSVQIYCAAEFDTLMTGFDVTHHGEIVESVGENCRHLHYFVARKESATA